MKSIKLTAAIAALSVIVFNTTAYSAASQAINQALTDSLKEAESVRRVYRENEAAQPAEDREPSRNTKIEIEVGDEFSSGGGVDVFSARKESFQEKIQDENIDSDMDSIEKTFSGLRNRDF